VHITKTQNTDLSTVKKLGSGEYFGEVALLDLDVKREGTISANANTVFLVITRETFLE